MHVAAGSVLETKIGVVEDSEALGAPREDVIVDGIVELLGVVNDGNECVLDILLSLVMMGGKCGAETVDESGPIDGGEIVVAADGPLATCRDETDGGTRRGGRSR